MFYFIRLEALKKVNLGDGLSADETGEVMGLEITRPCRF